MTQELLPCPFCGGEAHVVYHSPENTWGAHCTDCTASLYHIGLSPEEAIEAWNTRAGIPDPAAYVAAMDEVVALAERMADAYELLCGDTGRNYHESQGSVHAHLKAALTAARQARGEGS